MVVHIAAVYGHETNNRETAAELLALQGIYNTTEAARVALTEATKRVATRAVNLYLKGPTLLLIKQLCRYVGVKFTRVGALKVVPFVATRQRRRERALPVRSPSEPSSSTTWNRAGDSEAG